MLILNVNVSSSRVCRCILKKPSLWWKRITALTPKMLNISTTAHRGKEWGGAWHTYVGLFHVQLAEINLWSFEALWKLTRKSETNVTIHRPKKRLLKLGLWGLFWHHTNACMLEGFTVLSIYIIACLLVTGISEHRKSHHALEFGYNYK